MLGSYLLDSRAQSPAESSGDARGVALTWLRATASYCAKAGHGEPLGNGEGGSPSCGHHGAGMILDMPKARSLCRLIRPHLVRPESPATPTEVDDFLAASEAAAEDQRHWQLRGPGELMERASGWWQLLERLCPGVQSPIVRDAPYFEPEVFWEGRRLLGYLLRAQQALAPWEFLSRAIEEIQLLLWYSSMWSFVRAPDEAFLGALQAIWNAREWDVVLEARKRAPGLNAALGFEADASRATTEITLDRDGGIAVWRPTRRPIVLAEMQDGTIERLRAGVREVIEGPFDRRGWTTDLAYIGLAYRRQGADFDAGYHELSALYESEEGEAASDAFYEVLEVYCGDGPPYLYEGWG